MFTHVYYLKSDGLENFFTSYFEIEPLVIPESISIIVS
jgi:hypothetical protein